MNEWISCSQSISSLYRKLFVICFLRYIFSNDPKTFVATPPEYGSICREIVIRCHTNPYFSLTASQQKRGSLLTQQFRHCPVNFGGERLMTNERQGYRGGRTSSSGVEISGRFFGGLANKNRPLNSPPERTSCLRVQCITSQRSLPKHGLQVIISTLWASIQS